MKKIIIIKFDINFKIKYHYNLFIIIFEITKKQQKLI